MSTTTSAPPSAAAVVFTHANAPKEVLDTLSRLFAESVTLHTCEKDQAIHIKRGLEAASATGGLWHVICGREFGASVAHENNMLIVARLGRCHALAFQSYDESSLVRVAAPPRRAAQPAAAKAEDDDDAEEKAGTDAGTLAAGAS